MARFSLKWLFVGVALIGLAISAVLKAGSFLMWAATMSVFLVFALSSTYAAVKRLRAPFALGVALTCFARANSSPYWIDDKVEEWITDWDYKEKRAQSNLGADGDYDELIRQRGVIIQGLATLAVAGAVGVFGQWVAAQDRKREDLAK